MRTPGSRTYIFEPDASANATKVVDMLERAEFIRIDTKPQATLIHDDGQTVHVVHQYLGVLRYTRVERPTLLKASGQLTQTYADLPFGDALMLVLMAQTRRITPDEIPTFLGWDGRSPNDYVMAE